MQYILVENKTTVLLGPMEWRPRFFQSELDELEVTFKIPPMEVGYIDVNDKNGNSTGLEIFPVTVNMPIIDTKFQHLSGPFYTYEDNHAIASYTINDNTVDDTKQFLKAEATAIRYKKEISGTKFQLQGQEIFLDTGRENRKQYLDILNSINTATVSFKINNIFFDVTKTDIENMIAAIFNHVQTQFAWERSVFDSIDAAASLIELQLIYNEQLNGDAINS